jgi:hypothetical protein
LKYFLFNLKKRNTKRKIHNFKKKLRVGYSLPITLLKPIGQRANYFRDDEGSLPWGRELVHAVSLLDAFEDEVANVQGGLPNIAIMVAT